MKAPIKYYPLTARKFKEKDRIHQSICLVSMNIFPGGKIRSQLLAMELPGGCTYVRRIDDNITRAGLEYRFSRLSRLQILILSTIICLPFSAGRLRALLGNKCQSLAKRGWIIRRLGRTYGDFDVRFQHILSGFEIVQHVFL